MCFVWISEQTAIISLYNINWLVFITETECVYCAVRTESLYTVQVNICFRPSFDPWSVRVRFLFNPVSLGQGFRQVFTFLPVSISPFHSTNAPHSLSTCCSCQKNKWAKPGNLPKRSAISEFGALLVEKYVHLPLTRSLFRGGSLKSDGSKSQFTNWAPRQDELAVATWLWKLVFFVLNRFNIIISISIVNIFSSSWHLADDFETSAVFFLVK